MKALHDLAKAIVQCHSARYGFLVTITGNTISQENYARPHDEQLLSWTSINTYQGGY
jgi:hypothetical protein